MPARTGEITEKHIYVNKEKLPGAEIGNSKNCFLY